MFTLVISEKAMLMDIANPTYIDYLALSLIAGTFFMSVFGLNRKRGFSARLSEKAPRLLVSIGLFFTCWKISATDSPYSAFTETYHFQVYHDTVFPLCVGLGMSIIFTFVSLLVSTDN